MDTSNSPDDPTLNEQDHRDHQARQIAEIVEKDRRRRRRTLNILLLFLLITGALAGLVLALGSSDRQQTVATITPLVEAKVGEKTGPMVTKAVNEQLYSPEMDRKLDSFVQTAVDSNMSKQVEPKILNRLEDRLASFKTISNPIASGSINFTASEVRGIRKVVSEAPEQANSINILATRLDELKANTSRGEMWTKDKPEIEGRLKELHDTLAVTQASLDRLSSEVNTIVARLDKLDSKDPCAGALELPVGTFLTYLVKENSHAELFDMKLQVSIKNQKDGSIRGVTVYSDGKKIFGSKDIEMGVVVSFGDERFQYSLIPIFINRRRLVNDFIGFAISRSRKCRQPSASPTASGN